MSRVLIRKKMNYNLTMNFIRDMEFVHLKVVLMESGQQLKK